ncbi:uncharacterized protein [Chelonus insularis]|uniref:uncharacterized protein n=1 Tax=Chelonus insularis TaxID=460826 RepID=UPI00158BE5D6|nr:uncharacterized protein LOC118066449 [Chelonus insularis]
MFLLFMFTVTEVIGEITAIVKFYDDKELVLESVSPIIITIGAYSKYFSHMFNTKSFTRILEKMKETWRFHSSPSEQKILREYSDTGRLYTWILIIGAIATTFLFTAEPLFPRVVNFLFNKNETVPNRYPVPVYWVGVGMEENYYLPLSYSTLCIWIIINVEVTVDTTFIVMTQHAVALFAVTGHILENIPTEEDYQKDQRHNKDISLDDLRHQHYLKCIKSHKRAIQFAKYLETVNVWGFAVVIALHIPIMSVTAAQITTQAQNIQQFLKYSTFASIQLFHCFAVCLFSHQLITNSTLIQKSVIEGLWYECDPKIQKLLTLVIMRSQRECQLTAGKMVSISMDTFTVISAVIVYFDDKNRVLESIPPLITDTIGVIRELFEQMKENWFIYTGKVEQDILHSYSNYAKKFCYGYVGLGYTTTALFLIEPILPRVLASLMNLNETIPIRYATPVYWYGFDIEEHYYYLVPLSNLGVIFILVSNSTMDILFITLMQHAAALYMMENVPTETNMDNENNDGDDYLENIQYKYYVKCIKSHIRAIKFAEDLEAVNVWCLGIIITLNVIMLSVTATQVATQAQSSEELVKYGIFAVAQLLHIFIFCFFSQRLMNTSANIQQCICNGSWYKCTPRTQKLLTLVTLRSQLPCKLTAGKVAVLSMETFTVIVKTSASYFTVLMSMQ